MRKLLVQYAIALTVIILDQISKVIALSQLDIGEPVNILPFINFTLSYNAGVAFGIFNTGSQFNTILLTGFAALVSLVLILWIQRSRDRTFSHILSLNLILGGAIGNIIDRLQHGVVVDFIHWYIGEYSWPIFNLADAAICCGAVLLLLHKEPKSS